MYLEPVRIPCIVQYFFLLYCQVALSLYAVSVLSWSVTGLQYASIRMLSLGYNIVRLIGVVSCSDFQFCLVLQRIEDR